jgi:hypothetical protein
MRCTCATTRVLSAAGEKLLAGDLKGVGRALEESCRIAPCIVQGPAWLVIKSAAAVWRALGLLHVFHFSNKAYFRAFRAMWNGQIRLGRAAAIAEIMTRKTCAPGNSFDSTAPQLKRAA